MLSYAFHFSDKCFFRNNDPIILRYALIGSRIYDKFGSPGAEHESEHARIAHYDCPGCLSGFMNKGRIAG